MWPLFLVAVQLMSLHNDKRGFVKMGFTLIFVSAQITLYVSELMIPVLDPESFRKPVVVPSTSRITSGCDFWRNNYPALRLQLSPVLNFNWDSGQFDYL